MRRVGLLVLLLVASVLPQSFEPDVIGDLPGFWTYDPVDTVWTYHVTNVPRSEWKIIGIDTSSGDDDCYRFILHLEFTNITRYQADDIITKSRQIYPNRLIGMDYSLRRNRPFSYDEILDEHSNGDCYF